MQNNEYANEPRLLSITSAHTWSTQLCDMIAYNLFVTENPVFETVYGQLLYTCFFRSFQINIKSEMDIFMVASYILP